MPKIQMRVISEPTEGSREVLTAKGPGSKVIRGTDSRTFLCGGCRAILAKSIDPDLEVVYTEDEATGDFIPVYRVRDLVFRCKGCGAFNEISCGGLARS